MVALENPNKSDVEDIVLVVMRIPTRCCLRIQMERANYYVILGIPTRYATLMRKAVDPKVVPDSMGHDLDVNLNTYTQTPLDSRLEAVQTLESSFVN